MLYDDTARRFNFLAGLGIGAILGVGLAMLAIPQKRVRLRKGSSLLGGRSTPARLLSQVRRR